MPYLDPKTGRVISEQEFRESLLGGSPAASTPRRPFITRAAYAVGDFLGGSKIGEALGTEAAKGTFGQGIQRASVGRDLTPQEESNIQQNITGKQILGDAGKIGLSLAAPGGVAGKLGQAALRTGALGAAFGASSAVAEGQGGAEIGRNALIGAATGAAIPFASRAVGAGAGAAFRGAQRALGRKTPSMAYNEAVEIFRPKITSKLEQEAFKQGRIGKQGLLRGAPIKASPHETRGAEALQPLVEQGRISSRSAPAQIYAEIKSEIDGLNKGVRTLVSNPRYRQPFNDSQLNSRLQSARQENRLIFAGDKAIEKQYDTVIEEFKKFVEKKDTVGLFQARQNFDKYIRNKFPKAFKDYQLTGEINGRVQALRDVRRIANEYIADLLPPNNPYQQTLRAESYLIEAIENMATKVPGITTAGRIPRFFRSTSAGRNIKRAAIGTGILGGAYGGAQALFGD